MTNPTSSAVHHYNQHSFGPTHYYRSVTTGKRLAFRANEIASVRPDLFGTAVVTTLGGLEFPSHGSPTGNHLMTLKRLAILSAIGGVLWALIIAALAASGLSYSEMGKYGVMIAIAVAVVVVIYQKVQQEDDQLEYDEQVRREAQALDYDEEEPPHAA